MGENQDHLNSVAQIYHIDGRVTAIEGQLQGLSVQLNRIEGSLMNKEPFFNFTNVTTLMLMVAGLMYGINGFVDLRISQVSENVARNERISDRQEDRILAQEEFQREVHYEVGKFQTRLDEAESRRIRNENWIRGIDARVRKTEQQAAASEVSRKAIGDFVEDVDKYGSRKWIDHDKQ